MAAAAPSADDLAKKLASAKKVETKVSTGLDPAALAAMEKIHKDNGGDLAKIAKQLNVTFKPGASAKDAKDFATKMLTGTILAD